jgi:predicted nuclease of predicted toxin-antitoxin system
MKLLLDMNLSPRWVLRLRANGFEALHWSSIGEAHATDTEVLAWAGVNNFVLVTCDLDFGHLLAVGGQKTPSVLLLRVADNRPEVLWDRLVEVLWQHQKSLLEGAFLVLDEAQARVRILPLRGLT